MHNNDNIKLPLETLIVKLQNTGFRIGVDTRLQINQILQQYGEECMSNLLGLKLLLSPIVAKNKAQQKLFSDIFDEYIDQVQQYQQEYHTQQEETQTKDEQKLGAKKKWFVRISFLAVLVFVVVIFYSNQWFPFNPRVTTNDTIADTTSTNITDKTTSLQDTTNTVTPQDSIKEVQDTTKQELTELKKTENKRTIFDNKPKLERKEPITDPDKVTYDFKWWVKALFFAFFIVLWGLLELVLWLIRRYRLYGFRKKELESKFKIHETPPFKLDFPEQQKYIRPQNNIFDFATSLRQRRQADKLSFDIEHTIKQTIRKGGLPSLQFKAESKQSEYLILVDKQRTDQPQGMLLDYFIETLKNEDVNIEKFVFYNDPRYCRNNKHPDGVSLDELYNKFPEHDLIIFSKGEKLISTRQREISDWANHNFRKWENKAIVTPVPSTDWGYTEQKLAQLFVVMPTEISALLKLVEILTDTENYNFDKQRQINTAQVQISSDVQLWLTTISILDKIDWNLILAIGNTLYEKGIVKEQLLTFEKLNQLLAFPVLQGDEIPQTEKDKLVNDLTQYPEAEKVARTAILQMYDATKPPEKSYASSEKQIQTSTQGLKLLSHNKAAKQEYNLLQKKGLVETNSITYIYYSKIRKTILTSLIGLVALLCIILEIYLLNNNEAFATHVIVVFSLIAVLLGFAYNYTTINKQKIIIGIKYGNLIFIFWIFLLVFSYFAGMYYSLAFKFAIITSIIAFEAIGNMMNSNYEENNKRPSYYILRFIAIIIMSIISYQGTNNINYETIKSTSDFEDFNYHHLSDTIKLDSAIYYNNIGVDNYQQKRIDSAKFYYNLAIQKTTYKKTEGNLTITSNYKSPHYNHALIDYNFGVEYFNKDSFELAIQAFEKIEYDSLDTEKTFNIDLCKFYLNQLDSLANIIEYGTATDIDNNTYKTVKIGNQWWFAENLKTTMYNDSTDIPYIGGAYTDNEKWTNIASPAYCWLKGDEGYKNKYGALYNWYTVETDKLCPQGWHVPTDKEWKQLEIYLGMTKAEADDTDWRGASVGKKLKSINDWRHFNSINFGNNQSGFNALPGGSRSGYDGSFFFSGDNSKWWSSTYFGNDEVWIRYLDYISDEVVRDHRERRSGYYVRCVKNN